jgi:hypothetical protein
MGNGMRTLNGKYMGNHENMPVEKVAGKIEIWTSLYSFESKYLCSIDDRLALLPRPY